VGQPDKGPHRITVRKECVELTDWTDIGAADIVDDDDVVQVTMPGFRLAVYKIGETVYATDDRCTHQEASLSDGYMQGTTIECPRHQGVFDIRTGKAICAPLEHDVRTYDATVVDGRILVDLGPSR
jgi:naphthalene 1,2-dioxygenase system ferredoxin subunit